MEFILRDEFIKLGQLLKAVDLVSSGADAKEAIQSGSVEVNGATETRRGRKIVAGDVVEMDGTVIQVKA